MFQCVREINNDYEDVYVDGGLLCNYPIHAFDGMYNVSRAVRGDIFINTDEPL